MIDKSVKPQNADTVSKILRVTFLGINSTYRARPSPGELASGWSRKPSSSEFQENKIPGSCLFWWESATKSVKFNQMAVSYFQHFTFLIQDDQQNWFEKHLHEASLRKAASRPPFQPCWTRPPFKPVSYATSGDRVERWTIKPIN